MTTPQKRKRKKTTIKSSAPKVVSTRAKNKKDILNVRFVGGMQSDFIRVLNANTGQMEEIHRNGDSFPMHAKEVERLRKIGFLFDEV